MTRSSLLALAIAFVPGLFAAGCTASSRLDEEHETQAAYAAAPAALPPSVAKDTSPVQTKKQGFTTKEDTIEVESAQRNRRPEHTPVIVQRRAPAAGHAAGSGTDDQKVEVRDHARAPVG